MLPKTRTYVKIYDGQTKRMWIWDKVGADIKKNLIASLSTIKSF